MKDVAENLQDEQKWAKLLTLYTEYLKDDTMGGAGAYIHRGNVKLLIQAALLIGERKGIMPIPFTKDDHPRHRSIKA